jgi:hypothetical protein
MRYTCCALSLALLLTALGCGGGDSDPTGPGGGGGGGNTNHAPTVSINTTTTHLGYGGSATITVVASDADDDQLLYSYAGVKGTVSSSGPTATTAIFTAGQEWGQASVTVTVSDGQGGSTPATASMYVRNPAVPHLSLSAVSSLNANCDGFALAVSCPEAVLVTGAYIVAPIVSSGDCTYSRDFSSSPVSVPPGSTVPLRGQGIDCIWNACTGEAVSRYVITVEGKRPEPDGGSFSFSCPSFDPSDGSCN